MESTSVGRVLDSIQAKIELGAAAAAVPELFAVLDDMSASLGVEDRAELRAACRAHEIFPLLLEDPIVRRSNEKPRGYAGDAVMLDFIYEGLPPELAAATSLCGRQVFQSTAGHGAPARSVRYRRDLLAERVDALASRVPFPRLLSVACGHLREARVSRAATAGLIGEWVAMDQDATSLDVVSGLVPYGVVPMKASVRDLLRGTATPGPFDFVYSAGLYDYLEQGAATRLTEILFGMLEPGGELLIANFVPSFSGHAFVDFFMDWRLECRSEDAMRALAGGLASSEVATISTWVDPIGCVAYLEVRKSSQAVRSATGRRADARLAPSQIDASA